MKRLFIGSKQGKNYVWGFIGYTLLSFTISICACMLFYLKYIHLWKPYYKIPSHFTDGDNLQTQNNL